MGAGVVHSESVAHAREPLGNSPLRERESEGGYRGREVDGLLCWAVDYGGLGFSNVR